MQEDQIAETPDRWIPVIPTHERKLTSMLDEGEVREPARPKRGGHVGAVPGTRTEGVRQICPVLDHDHVGLECAHRGHDREVVPLGIDLENADASRKFPALDEGPQRTGRHLHDLAPDDLVGARPIEQRVAEAHRLTRRRDGLVELDCLTVSVRQRILVNCHASVSAELRTEKRNIPGLRFHEMDLTAAGAEHLLRESTPLGADVDDRAIVESGEECAEQSSLRLLPVEIHSGDRIPEA